MSFQNTPIDIQDINPYENLLFSKMDLNYRKVNLWHAVIWCVLLLIGVSVGLLYLPILAEMPFILILIVLLLLLVSFIFFLAYKSYDYMGYLIRQKDIIYKSGIFFRSQTVVPFCRIQHCETNQGPIDRWMGLAELAVFTAGGSGGDLIIPGLNAEDAERLKAFITKSIAHDEEE